MKDREAWVLMSMGSQRVSYDSVTEQRTTTMGIQFQLSKMNRVLEIG